MASIDTYHTRPIIGSRILQTREGLRVTHTWGEKRKSRKVVRRRGAQGGPLPRLYIYKAGNTREERAVSPQQCI